MGYPLCIQPLIYDSFTVTYSFYLVHLHGSLDGHLPVNQLHLRLHVRIIPGLLANDPVAVHFHKPLGCLVTGGRLVTCVQVMGGRVTKPIVGG